MDYIKTKNLYSLKDIFTLKLLEGQSQTGYLWHIFYRGHIWNKKHIQNMTIKKKNDNVIFKKSKDLNRSFIKEYIQMVTRIITQAFHKRRSPSGQAIRGLQMKGQWDTHLPLELKRLSVPARIDSGAAGGHASDRELAKAKRQDLAEVHWKRKPATAK